MISTIRVAKHDDLQVCDSIFSKLAIFWVVMGLSENFTVRPRKCRCMISTLRLDENNDSVAKAIIDTTADTSQGEGQDTWQHTRQCQGRGTGRHPGWHLAINWSIWRPRHWSTRSMTSYQKRRMRHLATHRQSEGRGTGRHGVWHSSRDGGWDNWRHTNRCLIFIEKLIVNLLFHSITTDHF